MFDSVKIDYRHACAVEPGLLITGIFRRIRVFFRVLFCSYGLQVVISYRFYRWTSSYRGRANALVRYLLGAIALLLHKLLGVMYDINISLDADIEPGLYIGHFGGIHIGRCTIGRWCNINQQVAIGENNVNEINSQITIGDNVWVGAHSTIRSGVTIGNGVTISVGTPVSKDIPSNALVAGASCRILQKEYDNSVLLGLWGK